MSVIKSNLPKTRTSKSIQHETGSIFGEYCLIKSYMTLQSYAIHSKYTKTAKSFNSKNCPLGKSNIKENNAKTARDKHKRGKKSRMQWKI